MSLINQMLQDLEQRKAENTAPAAQVRAVKGAREAPWLRRWALFLAMLAALAGLVYFLPGLEYTRRAPSVELPSAKSDAVAPAFQAPLRQPGDTPSVLQLASELSVVPVTALPPVAKPRAPIEQTQGNAPRSEAGAAAEKAQIPPAKIKKPVSAGEAASPAGINKEIRQLTPQQRAENAYRQAYASLQQGRMGEAEEGLRQALLLEPRHAAARQALAALLLESRHLESAEQLLQQGLELQPGNLGYATTLARLQVERGDVHAALATLQRNPPATENAEYHGFLAALLQRSERHKEAIDHYLAALKSNPASGPWMLGLGISLQADGQTARALEMYRRARQSGALSPELQAFAEQRVKQLQ